MCGFKDALQAFTHTYAHTHATFACKKEFWRKQTVTHFASADKMLLLEVWAGLWPSFSQPHSLTLPPVLLSTGVLNASWGPAGCWQTLRQQRSRAASYVLVSDLWPGASGAHFLTILLGHDCLIYDLDVPYLLLNPSVPQGAPWGFWKLICCFQKKADWFTLLEAGRGLLQWTKLLVGFTSPSSFLSPPIPHQSFPFNDVPYIYKEIIH